MKRGRKLCAMLLALVLVLGATWAAGKLNPDNQEQAQDPVQTIFSLDPQSVTALGWEYSEAVNFEKGEDGWSYAGDETFPLDASFLDAALDTLTEVAATKTIEAVEDWDQYTLEEPVCEITVTEGEQTHILKIGAESSLGGERYVSNGDGNAYLVDESILEPFQYGLYDLLAYETIPDMTAATGLEMVSRQQSYALEYLEGSGLAYSDDYVWFQNGQALDTQRTQELLACVTELSWAGCADYHASELSQYGLEEPAAVVTVRYTDEADTQQSFTLEIGDSSGDYRYARIAGSAMVCKIDGTAAETLMYTTVHELLPDEVLLMDWDGVTGLDIILDGSTHTFLRQTRTVTDEEGNETEETVFTLDGADVDLDRLMGMVDNLTSSGCASGLQPQQSETLRIRIRRDRDTFSEVELAFYPYDSGTCMTTLDGEATVFTDRESVAQIVEEIRSIISE